MLAVAAAGVDVIGRAGALGGVRGGVAPARPRRPAPAPPRRPAPGCWPMLTRATARPCTATPTMAQSMARLVNFWNDQPAAPGAARDPDLGEQLIGFQRGLEQALEELRRRRSPGVPDGPRATRVASSARTTAGRSAAGSPCASEPPIVPRCRTCGSPTWPAACASSGTLRASRSECARSWWLVSAPDRDVAAVVADVAELAQPADVDQHLGHGQPQLHQRQQRMPAGQELRLVAVLGRQVQGLVHGLGALVGERRGDHQAALRPRPAPPRRRPAPPGRCCGSRCTGTGCLPARPGPRPRWVAGSRAAARPRPSPCPACRTRTAARARRGTPAARGAARRPRAGQALHGGHLRARRPGRRAPCTTSPTRRPAAPCRRRRRWCRSRRWSRSGRPCSRRKCTSSVRSSTSAATVAAVDGHCDLHSAVLLASLIAAQTRCGVAGMSMCRTPRWRPRR